MNCAVWLEKYIKRNQPVTPKQAYTAGKSAGFSRKEIKDARNWLGKYIDTKISGDGTLWRWDA